MGVDYSAKLIYGVKLEGEPPPFIAERPDFDLEYWEEDPEGAAWDSLPDGLDIETGGDHYSGPVESFLCAESHKVDWGECIPLGVVAPPDWPIDWGEPQWFLVGWIW